MTDSIVQGRIANKLRIAVDALNSSLANLRPGFSAFCVQAASLGGTVADVTVALSSIRTKLSAFSGDLPAMVAIVQRALTEVLRVPAFANTLGSAVGPAKLSVDRFAVIAVAAQGVLASLPTFDQVTISAVGNTPSLLCDASSGVVPSLDQAVAALSSAKRAYSAAIFSATEFVAALQPSMNALSQLAPFLQSVTTANAVTVVNGIATAAQAVASFSFSSVTVADLGAAAALTSSLASQTGSFLLQLLPATPEVQLFMKGVQAVGRVQEAVGWIAGAFKTIKSSQAFNTILCGFSRFFGRPSASNSSISGRLLAGTASASGTSDSTRSATWTPAATRLVAARGSPSVAPSPATYAEFAACGLPLGIRWLKSQFGTVLNGFSFIGGNLTKIFASVRGSLSGGLSLGTVMPILGTLEEVFNQIGGFADTLDNFSVIKVLGAYFSNATQVLEGISADVASVARLANSVSQRALNEANSFASSPLAALVYLAQSAGPILSTIETVSESVPPLSFASLAVALPTVNFSPVTGILRSIASKKGVVNLIRRLVNMIDTAASSGGAIFKVVDMVKLYVGNGLESSGLLSATSKFKQLIPDVVALFSDLKASFSNFTFNATFVDKAKQVISTLARVVRIVGDKFNDLGPAITRTKDLLNTIGSFAGQGLGYLSTRLSAFIAELRDLRYDPDVMSSGLSYVVGAVVDLIPDLSAAPNLLSSVADLASQQISSSVLAPINGLFDSVSKLSGLSGAFSALASVIDGSTQVFDQMKGFANGVKAFGSDVKGALNGIKSSVLGIGSFLTNMWDTVKKVKDYLKLTKDSGIAKLKGAMKIMSSK